MKLLALDTATQACSVALQLGDTMLTRYEEPGRGHAELILPMVDALLHEAGIRLRDLDALAVGRGPGTFTGVRIAISVAQGLAFGADLRVIPVSDLAALAQRAVREGPTEPGGAVVACMDARMGEVYWAAYEVGVDGLVTATQPERLSRPDEVEVPGAGWTAIGSGWAAYPQILERLARTTPPRTTLATLLPRAAEVVRLGARDWQRGAGVAPEEASPVYLRDRVTHDVSQKT